MSTRRLRLELLIILAGVGCFAGLGLLIYEGGPFSYSSVCGRCGALQRTTEWQIPRTRTTLFKHSSIRDTPVSVVLTTNRIVASHAHQWVFAQGGGNGVRCALGRAHMVRSTVESPDVARFIEALERYDERSFRDKVLTNLFDDETTHLVRTLPGHAPDGTFSDAGRFHDWLLEQSEYFDEMITMFKKR